MLVDKTIPARNKVLKGWLRKKRRAVAECRNGRCIERDAGVRTLLRLVIAVAAGLVRLPYIGAVLRRRVDLSQVANRVRDGDRQR
jgi:hypothetical protein